MSLTKEIKTRETEALDDTLLVRKLMNDFGHVSLYHMKVYLRVRPLASKDKIQKCLSEESSQSVVLTAPENSVVYRNNSSNEEKIKQRFTFTKVFGSKDDQKMFFRGAVLGTVSEFVNGQNCLIFAYGATNSGKTYTVQGTASEPGVIPNAVELIFGSIGDRLDQNLNLLPINSCTVEKLTPKSVTEISALKESLLEGIEEFCTSMSSQCSDQSASLFDITTGAAEYSKLSIHESENFRFQLWVSFAEIYNENIFDLLDSSCPEKRRKLRLTLDYTGNSYIKDLKILPINSPREARQFLSLGRKNLRIASTKLNQCSSRSHCIFTIYLVKVVDSLDPQQAMINSLSFCDLAGSERVVKTQNTGDRLKEAGKINNSLMVFGRCIEALRVAQHSKERPVVPYRDSKLTQMFQFFFTGKGRASMIVNVSPSADMYEDTANVLKVSAIAKQVVSDQLERTFLNLTSGSQRLTDLWMKSGERWSSFSRGKTIPSKMSIMTQKEDSVIAEEDENEEQETIEEDQPDIQELIDLVVELEKKCNSLMDENEQLEVRLRKELSEEFQSQIVNMEKSYEQRMEKVKENAEEYYEKRLEIAERALTIHSRIQLDSSQEDMEDNDETTRDTENELTQVKMENSIMTDQIKILEQKVIESEIRIANFEAEVLELLKEKENRSKEFQDLSSKVTGDAETKILSITQTLQEKDQEVQRLVLKLKEVTESHSNKMFSVNEELNKKNVELQDLHKLLKESDTKNEKIMFLQSELNETQISLKEEKNLVAELQSKHEAKVKLLEEKIKCSSDKISETELLLEKERNSFGKRVQIDKDLQVENAKKFKCLSDKISETELFLEKERNSYEKRVQMDKDLQTGNAKKIKSLEEEIRSLIAKVSETTTASLQTDELQKKVKVLEEQLEQTQNKWKEAEEKSTRTLQDIEKLGDILFDKDTEISDLTTKLENYEKEALERQKLRLSLERHRQEAEDVDKKMNTLLETKDSEISLLKAQIATVERINTSEDFQPPTTRGRRRRKAANENKAPKDHDSSTSLVDTSYASKTSSSSSSPKESSKWEERQAALGILDFIKQSPPVLAARNAIGNIRESLKTKSSSEDEPVASGTTRKLRRKMYERDNYEPLECTPPKQPNTSQNVHTIVTRQLRSRK